MAGPSKKDKEQMRFDAAGQRQLAEQANRISQQQLDLSAKDLARRDEYQNPIIEFLKSQTSGNRNAMMTGAALPLAEITRGVQTAKENIINTLPPGAARQFAMAKLSREAPAQTATFMNQQYLGGMDKLANIGEGRGAFSLQQLGAAGGFMDRSAAGRQSASGIAGKVMEADAAAKAAQLGFLGSLAGTAGSVATGGLSGGGAPKGVKPANWGGGAYTPFL